MKLRTRTLVVFFATTALLLLVLNQASSAILLGSYEGLENKEVVQTVKEVQGGVLNGYASLNAKLTDWASWDDTYEFVVDNNTAYISSNLTPDSLKTFGVNFLLFVNSTGKLTYGFGEDLVNGTKMPVPQSVLGLVSTDPFIWNFTSVDANFTSLFVTPEGPLILASQPILTSEGSGPIHGALIFGRYFDAQYLETLSETLRLPLAMASYSNWQSSVDTGSAYFSAPSTFVVRDNSSSITGYYVISDAYGRPALVLSTTMPRDIYKEGLTTLSYIDFGVADASAVFGFVILTLTVRPTVTRVRRLVSELDEIGGKRDPSAKVLVSGNDEISSLGVSINGMLGEIEKKTDQLRKSERFSAIGELAAMVAHDLRNPLQGIANAAYLIKRNPSLTARDAEMLTFIQQNVKYSEKIVGDLLDYSGEVRLSRTDSNPKELTERSLSLVAIPPGIRVDNDSASQPALSVDVNKVERTFANIIKNAVDAMPDGGSLSVATKALDGRVEFSFKDSGAGIPKEAMEKMFTPLYTSKAKGMGFGLSISKRIVEAHGGLIGIESSPGKGTTVTVTLPLSLSPKGGEKV